MSRWLRFVCSLVFALAALPVAASPDGLSVAINFGADEPSGARSDVLDEAGVLGTVNWNNIDGPNGGPMAVGVDSEDDLEDSDVTVEWVSNGTWASTGRGEENNTAPEGPDRNLMTGYLDTDADNPNSVSVSGLSSVSEDSYDVYVYINGGVLGRGGDYTLNGLVQTVVDNAAFTGDYVFGEDVIVFEGLSGDSFTLTGTPTTGATRRAPINAVEIAFGGDEVIRPQRTITQTVTAEECAPGGRGPLAVTLSEELADGVNPAEVVNVTETITGDITAADITGVDAGAVTDIFPVGTTDAGFVTAWLLLGPFTRDGGANPGEDLMRLDYLTDGDSEEADLDPVAGDTVEPDFNGAAASTGLAATDNGINPGGVATWTAFVDDNDTLDFNDYYGANIDNIMMYALTYVTLEEATAVNLCLGSDDALQVYVDGVEVWINNVDRGAGAANQCQDNVDLGVLEAGTYQILAKVFEGGGGHALRLGLQDSGTLEPAPFTACFTDAESCPFSPVGAGISLDVTRQALADGIDYGVDISEGSLAFRGAVTAGDESRSFVGGSVVDLSCDARVVNLTCTKEADGSATVSWENSDFAGGGDIVVSVEGDTVATLSSAATSATVPASAFADDFAAICVDNGAGSRCCTFIPNGVIGLGDITAGGDGTGTASPDVIGINADLGVFETTHNFAQIANTGDAFQPVEPAISPFIDSVFIIDQEVLQITSEGATFTFPFEDFTGVTFDHILSDVTHDIDKGIEEIWAGGDSTWDSAVSIHGAAGITYDLAALRDAHGDLETFRAYGGVDQCGSALISIYAILTDDADEVLETVLLPALAANTGDGIVMDIPSDAGFLTLAVGLSNSNLGCDHGVFANARITTSGGGGSGNFARGDADASGQIALTDGIALLGFLFLGEEPPECLDAADGDNNGVVALTDAVVIFNWLFLGQAAPPAPSPSTGNYPPSDCGPDPEGGDLGCASPPAKCS